MKCRSGAPLGRCLSCGMPLTMIGRMYLSDRFCEDCYAYQTRDAVVDTWRTIANRRGDGPCSPTSTS